MVLDGLAKIVKESWWQRENRSMRERKRTKGKNIGSEIKEFKNNNHIN